MGASSNSTAGICGITIIHCAAATLVGALLVGNLRVARDARKSAADYCRQAEELLASEKFQAAREAARRALEIDSHSAEAECLLGMAELGLGNFDAAGRDPEKALELKPGLIPAHRTLGEMYLNQKRLRDARRQFDLVLNFSPNDFDSLYGVGLTFLLDHQPGTAINEFDKALKIKPRDPSLLASLLKAQLQLKQEAQATATLTKLDGQFDNKDPRRMELAAMLVNEGAYQLAIQQFRRLLEIQPESYDLNYNLALAYHRAEEEDQAAALLASLLEHQDNAELQNLLGDVEESSRNKSRCLAAFRRAAELQSQNEDYRYDYAQSLVRASSLNEALEVFQAATRDFPGSVRMWLGGGGRTTWRAITPGRPRPFCMRVISRRKIPRCITCWVELMMRPVRPRTSLPSDSRAISQGSRRTRGLSISMGKFSRRGGSSLGVWTRQKRSGISREPLPWTPAWQNPTRNWVVS